MTLSSDFMPGRLGTVAGCILLGGWGCEGGRAPDVGRVVQGVGRRCGKGVQEGGAIGVVRMARWG